MDMDKEKLDRLSQRIREAETKPDEKPELFSPRGAGYDFAGTLLGSVILGLILDRVFGTGTWCLIGTVVMGFVAGVYGLWKASQKPNDKE